MVAHRNISGAAAAPVAVASGAALAARAGVVAVGRRWAEADHAAIMAVALVGAATGLGAADREVAAMAQAVPAAAVMAPAGVVTITAERDMGWLRAEPAFFNGWHPA